MISLLINKKNLSINIFFTLTDYHHDESLGYKQIDKFITRNRMVR